MTAKKRVVATGLGVICGSGIGIEKVWGRCLAGHNAIGSITSFDTHRYKCKAGGQIDDFNASAFISPQIIQQTDRSAHMGMAACHLAAEDADLELKNEDPNRVGIYFSNLVGGMHFAESELYAQGFLGPSRVNAYQAIAWFYAAAQGQWSIKTGIKGHAKTVVADRAGGLQSIGLATHAIQRGHSDVSFAGGFEAPLVPYAFLMYGTTGMLSNDTTDPLLAYRPFHKRRKGLVLGEGSGIVILEDLEHAKARGARIYAEVAGFSVCLDSPGELEGQGLARCFSAALDAAGMKPADIDHVCAEGTATRANDATEAAAIRRVFGTGGHAPSVSSPKSMFGHTLAAAGAIDAALACRMIETNSVLPTLHLDEPDPDLGIRGFNAAVEQKEVNAVLCCCRGMENLNTALVLRRYEA